VTVTEATLANATGGSRPAMLVVARAEATLALWPLLSGELRIGRLTLAGVDLLLETDTEGRGNWVFARPEKPAVAEAPEATREAGRRLGIQVEDLTLADARIAWRDGRAGTAETLEIRRFTVSPIGETGRDAVAGAIAVRGVPLTLEGEVGDLRSLAEASVATPWPFRFSAAAAGARITAEGTAARPMAGQGWRADVALSVPALTTLSPLLPALTLPPLRDVAARATLSDGPTLQTFSGSAGESDLGSLLAGLTTTRIDFAGGGDTPVRLTASGRYGEEAVALEAETRLMWPAPVTATLQAAGATVTATGTVNRPTAASLALTIRAPAQPGWPGIGPIQGSGRIALTSLDDGVAFTGVAIATAAGDAAGEIRIRPGERPVIQAQLASRRLDLAALQPAPAGAVNIAPPAGPTAGPTASPAPATPPGPRRVIPDTRLPLEALRRVDATIGWDIGELVTPSATFRAATIEAANQAGRLRATASIPAGRLRLAATVDAASQPPTLHVTADSDGADAGLLLAALGVPGGVTGRLDLDVDLRGQGASLRPILATASGHLGIALVEGRADASLLRNLPRELRGLLSPPGNAGDLVLRCGALRTDLARGSAELRALLLDLPFGRIGGDGSLNLADETLAIRLFPDLRLGPIQLRAPVRVGGTLAAPQVAVPPDALVATGLGALLSIPGAADRTLQNLAGAPPECPAALTVARGGRPGLMPSLSGSGGPIPGVTREIERRIPAPVQDLFRGLLGR